MNFQNFASVDENANGHLHLKPSGIPNSNEIPMEFWFRSKQSVLGISILTLRHVETHVGSPIQDLPLSREFSVAAVTVPTGKKSYVSALFGK